MAEGFIAGYWNVYQNRSVINLCANDFIQNSLGQLSIRKYAILSRYSFVGYYRWICLADNARTRRITLILFVFDATDQQDSRKHLDGLAVFLPSSLDYY